MDSSKLVPVQQVVVVAIKNRPEQDVLRTAISRTEEESCATMYRWRQAENVFSDLQEQPEPMGEEYREERGRRIEAIGRMERRAMEKELNTAAVLPSLYDFLFLSPLTSTGSSE
ncbi:hypothetical protein F5144DRAFT_607286 [Chaetomium tenue]|uniref:Uncharacterized protein n=1 Tax=Chaetomium tenue TaxID=1854479 RepID=A0ACB7NYV9_9PEZI|nr:hypothetical protein F5144DRAFT_607286 [Chaetomium globosum]